MMNRLIVTYNGVTPDEIGGYPVNNIKDSRALELFSISTGTRIGVFPAFVDLTHKKWLVIDSPMSEMGVKLDDLIQKSKSLDQKTYENKFFSLCKDVLEAAGDPRFSDASTPKLGMDELVTLIESYNESNFNLSIKHSLKLLSLDAALKRFNLLWWDSAMLHNDI
jgi:hypothetical protein